MLQSAIFADLQVNNFGIPTVRLMPRLPLGVWAKGSFAQFVFRLGGTSGARDIEQLSQHLRRDIGLTD